MQRFKVNNFPALWLKERRTTMQVNDIELLQIRVKQAIALTTKHANKVSFRNLLSPTVAQNSLSILSFREKEKA